MTFGVRPEHLRPGEGGPIEGEVLVAERLGGETYLYVQIAPGEMLVVQADGENPTRVHERVADPASTPPTATCSTRAARRCRACSATRSPT